MPPFSATVLLPLRHRPATVIAWPAGPLPLKLPNRSESTDASLRATYIDERAAGVLYGMHRHGERRHFFCESMKCGPATLRALEWLRLPAQSNTAGVLIAHLSADVKGLTTFAAQWSDLLRFKLANQNAQTLMQALEKSMRCPITLAEPHQDPLRIAFLESLPDRTPAALSGGQLDLIAGWQMMLAAALKPGTYAPDAKQEEQFLGAKVPCSTDWSAMVLRDGAAFIGHQSTATSFVARFGALYVRTIYTDALLIACAQRLGLLDLSDRLAKLGDPARHPRGVERLDAEFSRFRNQWWWQHLTQHGIGNDLLLNYQHAHRVVDLMEQVKSELDDYSRQTNLRAARILNVAVAVFALAGVIAVLFDGYILFNPPPSVPEPGTIFASVVVLILVLAAVIAAPLGGLSRWRRLPRQPYDP